MSPPAPPLTASIERGELTTFTLADLRLTLSPRLGTRDSDHVRALAECFDQLPPILVYAPSNEVIDGVHRVMAARQLGLDSIAGRAMHGLKEDAYVEAVRANVTHGKPLTVGERRAAARRMLGLRPEWSDRRVASLCGLASQTVARERPRSTAAGEQPAARVGRDGRIRPSDPSAGRLRVAELVRAQPGASLRTLARQAGTSQATALDVKRRIHRGDNPLPHRLQAELAVPDLAASPGGDAMASTVAAAAFLQWFERHRISDDAVDRVGCVPKGRVYVMADAAAGQSKIWARVAAALEGRARKG